MSSSSSSKPPTPEVEGFLSIVLLSIFLTPDPQRRVCPQPNIVKQSQSHIISEFLSICTPLALSCQFFSPRFMSKHLCACFRNLGVWRGITPQYWVSSSDLKVPNRCHGENLKSKLRWEELFVEVRKFFFRPQLSSANFLILFYRKHKC